MFNGIYIFNLDGEVHTVLGNSARLPDLYSGAEGVLTGTDGDDWEYGPSTEADITSYDPDGHIIWREEWVWEATQDSRGYWMQII